MLHQSAGSALCNHQSPVVSPLHISSSPGRRLRPGPLMVPSRLLVPLLQNNKDYFDQGLDEVKLLQYVNGADPNDEAGILRLHDFFYFKVSRLIDWAGA